MTPRQFGSKSVARHLGTCFTYDAITFSPRPQPPCTPRGDVILKLDFHWLAAKSQIRILSTLVVVEYFESCLFELCCELAFVGYSLKD